MSWKKTLDDPIKMMEYRRPVFMLGVGLAYFSAKMKSQIPGSLVSGYIGQMGSMYNSMVPSIKQLIKPQFPTGLTSLSGMTNILGAAPEDQSSDPSSPPDKASAASSPIKKQYDAVTRYIKRQTTPGSQLKSAIRWVGRKLKKKKKKKRK